MHCAAYQPFSQVKRDRRIDDRRPRQPDLAVSQPDQTVDGVGDAGQVWVFYGSPTGLTSPPDIISVTKVATGFGFGLAPG